MASKKRSVCFSWKRDYRLTKRWQFDHVFRTGRRYRGRLVRFICCDSPDGSLRFGFIVGKRHGKAYLRNRLKRAIRESLRLLCPVLKVRKWFVIEPVDVNLTFKSVFFEFMEIFLKQGWLQKKYICKE